ncbi:hypothetical protein OHA72_19895 [Dactylosporangium sp. NBC_01737]|uniref:hypothetical protein n=1 Tax=Dactylosporangium sp. NBC_01737 TaxID=2975959 RepID=UPI002E0F1E2D|nr:hypothetical protein OHA72_19895 [Dactylosporangium sp. NBC_01737]
MLRFLPRFLPRRALRVALLGMLLGVLAALGYVTPAAAHGADAPAAVDYVVRVDSVSVPGVAVRAVEGGARLELRSTTDRTVVVLGLQGEPFLRIGPDGVAGNHRSPTWAASRSVTGRADRTAGQAGEPDWRRMSTQRTVRWHDERARELPARAWSVPLEMDGTTPGIIRGTVRRADPPQTGWWWSGALLAAVAIGALALASPVPSRSPCRSPGPGPGRDVGRWALAAIAVVAGGVTVAWIVAGADLATSPAESLATQLLARLWPLLTGVGVLAAAVLQVLRRPVADIVTAIAGACLAVMTGFADAAVFSNGSLAGPGWSRWAVATALAGGLGLLAAGGIRWYRAAPTTAPTTAPADAVDHTLAQDK